MKLSLTAPAVGKESVFVFLTRKGCEDNKAELKKGFEIAATHAEFDRGHIWSDFENEAEQHFARVKKAIDKAVKKDPIKFASYASFVI